MDVLLHWIIPTVTLVSGFAGLGLSIYLVLGKPKNERREFIIQMIALTLGIFAFLGICIGIAYRGTW